MKADKFIVDSLDNDVLFSLVFNLKKKKQVTHIYIYKYYKMGGTVKVKIVAARDLPVMDRSTKLTDAYAELRFGETYHDRTSICRKTLNPAWDEDFRIDVSDNVDLQDNPLELRVWDHDLVSADDIIGSVFIDLTLALEEDNGSSGTNADGIQGWFPIYDSLLGIRGELHVSVKVPFFRDLNPFTESSPGVAFFSSGGPSSIVSAVQDMKGFIEEVLVDDDPEHHWKDTFRSSRTSNETRELLLFKLSGRVRRLIGHKALDIGCNAILGYTEYFDLENDNGIVIRGFGTACALPEYLAPSPISSTQPNRSSSPAHSKSSSPSLPFVSPSSLDSNKGVGKVRRRRTLRPKPKTPLTEITLCTIKAFPSHAINRLGCVVTARSVKMVGDARRDSLTNQRDQWWNELRDEVRSHARALRCSHVIAYQETMEVKNDMAILTASGTAAVLRPGPWNHGEDTAPGSTSTPTQPNAHTPMTSALLGNSMHPSSETPVRTRKRCSVCHIPFSRWSSPFSMRLVPCELCHRRYVPEILLSSAEMPPELPTVSHAQLIEARVCRTKRKGQGEVHAQNVSELLPFVEYDVHRQLVFKLRIYGMNAAFGLRHNIVIGENYIISTATATAVFCASLPPPPVLQLERSLRVVDAEDEQMLELQSKIQEVAAYNQRTMNNYRAMMQEEIEDDDHLIDLSSQSTSVDTLSDNGDSNSDDSDSSSSSSCKSDSEDEAQTTFVMDVNDDQDEDFMAVLLDVQPPSGVTLQNITSCVAGNDPVGSTVESITLQRHYRIEAPSTKLNQHLTAMFNDLYTSLAFKIRRHVPCVVSGLRVHATFGVEDVLQVTAEGMVLSLSRSPTPLSPLQPTLLPPYQPTEAAPLNNNNNNNHDGASEGEGQTSTPDEMLFEMEGHEEQEEQKTLDSDHHWVQSREVKITPLYFLPGFHIQRVLGRISQHLVRESERMTDYGMFTHSLIIEASAILRSQAAAVGANAIINYHLDFHVSMDNPGRAQGYAMVTVSGDAAVCSANPQNVS
eukprot:gb/GECH01012375.1/.p1 GENE.gb/GECH01012375.1/~~gb/GECH01012375.1/.p1  ORF type:complete len:1018 (+),score=197.21 gb/GECH01012375.1/:1-3054(+)